MGLPNFIKPMLAKSSQPFDSENHFFELKWDGTRCILFWDDGRIRLQNRRLKDITYRYPEFSSIKIRAKSAVIDGEIVVLHEGKPDFFMLQRREHVTEEDKIEILSKIHPATYVGFDLLYIERESILSFPLEKRRKILEEIFEISEFSILSMVFSHGKELFEEALKLGFEGIMAKEKGSPYIPGKRSSYWLKIKKFNEIDAIICGITEGEGKRKESFGALILGVYHHGRLVPIGQVGTGFNEEEENLILENLQIQQFSPFLMDYKSKRKIMWCKPKIVVRVKYQEWTEDKKLRAPVFKGVRWDKSPEECELEE